MTSWFFIEMAAKSALICSIALLLAMALKHRAAADRAMVLRVGAGLLLALPLLAAFPMLQIEAFAAPALADTSMSPAEMERLLTLAASLPEVEPSIWDDPAPLLLILWAAGALAVLARLVVGLATLSRWTRTAEPVTDPFWMAALDRARIASGAPDNLRLMVADRVPGPLGWGFRKPVILIDHDTYAEPEEADAILAHEVAHVARRDWPALMLTRLVTALFWFNPLIWTLAREAIQQAEEAADAHAARVVEPTRYAETLLSWGQIGRGIGVPANSIAPGARALSRRVRAVLDKGLVERSAGSRLAIVATLLCVGVAAPVAALELVQAARPDQPPAPHAPYAPQTPIMAAMVQPGQAPLPPEEPAYPGAPAAPPAPGAPQPPAAPGAPEPELAVAMQAVRAVMPQVSTIVRNSLQSIDPEQLARAINISGRHAVSAEQLRAALAQARAHMPNEHELAAQLARVDVAAIERQVRASLPDEAALRAQIRRSLAQGGAGMMQGADGMERGADRMIEQARRFRDRGERERIIARERARGHNVTHEELLGAARDMEEGARDMREGARDMRRGAREMAEGDDD
jgi:beta-lactamase regulating signal transducer with metallopeptidase domain